ncbi:MAG: phosphate ABC transporter permease PstA [Chloroflexi bacterium]|nr:phosphate ABC transporter permease PstA [Chloroflexota bacterium]
MIGISPKRTQWIAFGLCWAAAIVAIAAMIIIIAYVFIKGLGVIDWNFLSSDPKGGLGADSGGIRTSIAGTLWTVVLTLGMAAPVGIGAGIYMAEYARDNWFTAAIRWVIETLAGIPSILFGLFGFALFVMALSLRMSILAGSLTLACLVLPTIIRTTEEAVKAVPRSFREASYALGATKWQTIRHVVLASAMPGIVTAVILALGRIVGETACLYVTMGGSGLNFPDSPFDPGRTLSLDVLYRLFEANDARAAFGAGVMLIITILIINGLTRWISNRWMARMHGR